MAGAVINTPAGVAETSFEKSHGVQPLPALTLK